MGANGNARGRLGTRWLSALAFAVLVLALLLVRFYPDRQVDLGPFGQVPPRTWNVLLVSLDTTRPDRLEACGGAPVATPALNRVLGDGVLFTEMIAPAPITLPAHASLFTGLNPHRHGVRENTEFALPAGSATVAAAFRDEGYATAAFVAAFVMDRRFGLDQGFEHYGDNLSGPEAGLTPYQVEIPGEIVAARAAGWIRDHAARRRATQETQPFFLFVHFYDAHAPYQPPAPYRNAFPGDPYAGELAYQDHCLGIVLDALEASGEAQRTLIWVVSDHGESLGEHGEATHSLFIYDCTLRAVSILRFPPADGALDAGAPRLTVTDPASLIDVAPTLCELCGFARAMRGVEGHSLLPRIRGTTDPERVLYCETLSPRISYNWAPLFGVRSASWKYVRAPQPELYNLREDAGELQNLIDDHPQRADTFSRTLDSFLAHEAPSADAQRTLSEEERERLRSLGYLSSGGSETSRGADLRDPKEMVGFFLREYQRAKNLLYAQRYDEAASAFRQALQIDPLNNSLLLNLANALRFGGRPRDASYAYREALRIQPASPRTWKQWGDALLAAGEADSAAWAFRRAAELLPRSPDPWEGLGDALRQRRQAREAAAAYDSALARGGDEIRLHRRLAVLYGEQLGQPAKAIEHLDAYARLLGVSREEAARRLPR